MKNSPHRHKHQRRKAIRKNSQVDLNPPQQKPNTPYTFNAMREPSDRLKPLNKKVNQEMLTLYKKNLEQVRQHNSNHIHKRTSPGSVQGEGPYTHIQHNTNKTEKKWNQTNLEKSNRIARKIIKNQNQPYKKAA